MPYKYQDKIDLIEAQLGCTCFESYGQRNLPAYRFTFNEIEDSRNFIPMGILHPSMAKRCGAWALSFHETLQESKDAWMYLTADKPNKYKKLGTAIAEGRVEYVDGVCCSTDERGHFDCHEFEDTDFRQKFTIAEILKDAE